ncbi:MAG: transposase [Desulfosarcinaceae bacterium]|jgi:hypothetical protein
MKLVESYSWSTVKVDRSGLQFFWEHVLQRDWQWINLIKAPEVKSLPDILTLAEVERLIGATRRTRKINHRTVSGEDYLWLVFQHALPKGFRRVRDYGFLHGNAKKLLSLVQMVLHVLIKSDPIRTRPAVKCPRCKAPMHIIAFRPPGWASG